MVLYQLCHVYPVTKHSGRKIAYEAKNDKLIEIIRCIELLLLQYGIGNKLIVDLTF